MEQDQEDFNTWDASWLDHLALDNFAESPEIFSNDGDPGLSNLVDSYTSTVPIPLAESANLNTESAVLLPSHNEVNDYDPYFDASELLAQSADPTEDEVFRFVNLDSDASDTDRYPSESLAHIASANSVPVAQSTGPTGDYMSTFNDMDLDAPYAFSQSLASTTTSGLVQAAQSADVMEDGNSRIIDLDPDPVMAASEPASTSSEQLPPPVSTDRVLPIEVAQSAKPQMIFDGSGPSNPSYLTTQPHSFAFPPNEIITAMPTPEDQLRPKTGNSFPSGGYVPIQPKPAAISQITELPSTSEPPHTSILRSPSQETLAYRPASSVSKGKRKRLRSPPARPSDIPKDAPEDCFRVFPMSEQSEAAKDKDQQQPVAKRTRSDRTCLRCQMYKVRCSGVFPCERCESLFESEVKKRHSKTLQWKYCIDSDILELNFFLDINMRTLIAQCCPFSHVGDLDLEITDMIQERGRKAAFRLMKTVFSSAIEAGLPRVLGFQWHRGVSAGSVPPLISAMEFLSSEPLRRHKICSDCPGRDCSTAWMFAAIILQPDLLAEIAGFSVKEIRSLSVRTCINFYVIIAEFLRKAKAEWGSISQYRAAAIEHLEIVYCLITYHSVQDRLKSQFTMAADQTISQEVGLLIKTWACGKEGDNEAHRILENLQWQRKNGLRFLKLMRNEGWDHLQAYMRQWLRRLGRGHGDYGDVILKNFHLNTLCRINHKDKVEDDGQVPPDFDQRCDNIMLEVLTTVHSLTEKKSDIPSGVRESLLRAISNRGKHVAPGSLMDERQIFRKRSPDCHICDLRALDWLSSMIRGIEQWVMETKARKDSHGPEGYAVIPPDDIPDHKLGLTKSKLNYHNRPMTEFHGLEPFLRYYKERVESELAKTYGLERRKIATLYILQILSDVLSEMS